MPQATTESVENYLKAIFKLENGGGVGTGEIANRLHISSSSVSRMLKRLSKQEWVEHSPYRGVRLTEKGRRQALRVIRNHRILETYLAEILGVPWDRVDGEVEQLEHGVSDELINRMEEALGFPKRDPHGSPIPDREGNILEPVEHLRLSELPVGHRAEVRRIADAPPTALAYLEEREVLPGAELELLRREPFEGPLVLRVGEQTIFLSVQICHKILVTGGAPKSVDRPWPPGRPNARKFSPHHA